MDTAADDAVLQLLDGVVAKAYSSRTCDAAPWMAQAIEDRRKTLITDVAVSAVLRSDCGGWAVRVVGCRAGA